jgi:lysozyme family protein
MRREASPSQAKMSRGVEVSFADCLPVILQSEGGFVDDPQDPGGATNLGVTLKTLSGWRSRACTIAEVQALTPADVAPIYQADYWNVAHCGDCPAGVDLMVFDEAVNQGPGRALRSLQAAVGVVPDGAFGAGTLAAVKACDPVSVIKAIAADREAFYRSLPSFPHFGAGWLARLSRTQGLALQMAANPAASGAPNAGAQGLPSLY